MRNKLTIIISDINGSKHYTIRQIIKKIFLYLVLAIFILIVFGIIWIKFLTLKINNIKTTKQIYKQQAEKLINKNEILLLKIKNLQNKINFKSEKLEEINDKISDLEVSMGLKRDTNETTNERINLLQITSLQRKEFLKNIPNGFPVKNRGITSKFGWRINPISHKKEFHAGIDLRAKIGEKIYAPADGIVEFAGYSKRSGYGNLIIIDHNFGFKTLYGHLKKVAVRAGEFVKKGTVIGYTGSTGFSTGPHLHYGIMYIQRFLNPYYFLKWNRKNFNHIFKKVRRVKWQSLAKAIQSQILPLSHQARK